MLVGFYKTHEDYEAEAKIIKYADRIWLLNERGDALFRRQFIVNVSPDSKKPLKEIRIAIPVENLTEVDVINKECFNEELIFNSPHILTTNNYAIIKAPENQRDYGIIEDDVNKSVEAIYDNKVHRLISLKLDKKPVEDKKGYTLCLQGYHFKNASAYLNILHEELLSSGQEKVVTTSAQQVLEEYLRNHQNVTRKVEGRLVYLS